MDKAWAARAGLGWIGKHSNLITRERGSWVFLGELILNLDLAYDTEIVPDHCGTCTLCLDACPTGAIIEPYVVDSGKCISHATIESRAPKPRRGGRELDGWLYGCDTCQDVCPGTASSSRRRKHASSRAPTASRRISNKSSN